jgi:hypothetical protein
MVFLGIFCQLSNMVMDLRCLTTELLCKRYLFPDLFILFDFSFLLTKLFLQGFDLFNEFTFFFSRGRLQSVV